MTGEDTSRFVRLRVEMVVEVCEDGGGSGVTGAALRRISEDEHMPAEERAHAEAAVKEDEAEALAYLVDPFDLVSDIPGVELTQASWSSELIDYDPDSPDWDPDEDDEGDEGAVGYAEEVAEQEDAEEREEARGVRSGSV
ncbi:hypothetical protein [Streptomyces sp. NPDC059009]|uniref:hypothetical protein n=1 Tax=Streptomyces sp. NPDC059009 TaxID=3346694 RepID=UPI00368CE2EF